jgi:hypothetical protein
VHDVQRIRGEHPVHLAHVPGRLRHVDQDGRTQVRRSLVEDALAQPRHRVRELGGLPDQPGHLDREMNRMLAGAAADLEHVLAARECLAQDLEDRSLVAFAGVRMR